MIRNQLDSPAPGPVGLPVLTARDLKVGYGDTEVVHGVSFDLHAGETLGIVGESGSGKSTLVLGLIKLLPEGARVDGHVRFGDLEMLSASERRLRRVRGRRIGVVYQDALRSLNPVMRVGDQVAEVFQAHGDRKGADKRAVELLEKVGIPDPESRARMYPHEFSGGMRQRVMIAMALAYEPEILIADEPTTALDVTIQAQILELIIELARESNTATILVTHDLGVIAQMCRRVLVMYAGRVVESGTADELFENPKHPYTLSLLKSMPRLAATKTHRFGHIEGQPPEATAEIQGCAFAARCYAAQPRCSTEAPELKEILPGHSSACLLTQDSSEGQAPVAVEKADKPVAVEEADKPVAVDETGDPNPHLGVVPRVPPADVAAPTLLELQDVSKHYRTKASMWSSPETVLAVDGVDLVIRRGESLGLVGESGSGKSTLGRVVAGLERPTSGRIIFDGADVTDLKGKDLRGYRKRAQLIYQDPRNSLNRRMTVRSILQEALAAAPDDDRHGPATVDELLTTVGLSPRYASRYPSEFSGGQAQRVAIARALAAEPAFIVADEAVSALDVSIQGQILNLLRDLQEGLGLAFLFIAHDLAVVQQACDRVAVMYFGKIVESGDGHVVFDHPCHPYSASLRSAHPIPDPALERSRRRIVLGGDVPNPSDPPPGCRFHPRCPIGPIPNPERSICIDEGPPLVDHEPGHRCACHFAGQFEVSSDD